MTNSLIGLSREEKLELLQLLEEKHKRQEDKVKYNKIDSLFPKEGPLRKELYTKMQEFFRAGSSHKIRLFLAGNRIGKTTGVGSEFVYHATGNYPDDWAGYRFDKADNWWICGTDSKAIIDTIQPMLLGPMGSYGTGLIPRDCLDLDSLPNLQTSGKIISSFRIKHKSGDYCTVTFKTYKSDVDTFQSFEGSIWIDEECPLDIYAECLKRTMGKHIMMVTFTPLKGATPLIKQLVGNNPKATGSIGESKYIVRCGMRDVPHLTEEDIKIILDGTPPWMREAVELGIPSIKSGIIYQVPWEKISVTRFPIPEHWKRYAGFDVGNKTAAVWFAIDPDTGIHYCYHEYYRVGELPAIHSEMLLAPGHYIPFAIDTAAHQRSSTDGKNLFDLFKSFGLDLHDADKSINTGLWKVWEMLDRGQLKVFNDLSRFYEEYVSYARDEKEQIIKKDDHIMDALRYGIMTGSKLARNKAEFKELNAITLLDLQVSPEFRWEN